MAFGIWPWLGEAGGIETAWSHLNVCVHASKFPERLARALRDCLRTKRVSPQFHYQTSEQAKHWLAVHQAYAPDCSQPDGPSVYDQAYASLASHIPASRRCHLIGLGCGPGHKEARLAERLAGLGHLVSFTPVDTSLPLILRAVTKLQPCLATPEDSPPLPSRPQPLAGVVCDLEASPDLPEILAEGSPQDAVRVVTFFGMLPNLEPGQVLPHLSRLVGPVDRLLISANLNPDPVEETGLQRLISQYQNPETERWLTLFLCDLGVSREDGTLHWRVERAAMAPYPACFSAWYRFHRSVKIDVEGEFFSFAPGEELRVFFSYRYTPSQGRLLLAQHGLKILDFWSDPSGEEGVFLCGRDL